MVAGMVVIVPVAAFATTTTVTTPPSPGSTTPSSGPTQPSNPLCAPSAFSPAQQYVASALSGRVTQLNSLLSAVGNTANHLTAADQQTLQHDISAVELPGIGALQTQVQQATTCAELRMAARSMVFDYRVYYVMTPQTHLAIVADDETAIEATLGNLETTIASAIDNSADRGKNVSAAQSAFSDLKNEVSAAGNSTNGLADELLAQTPQGFPGNWQVFGAARTSLSNARNDLHAAYNDGRQIRSDLQ
ncbi:MAG TPA: hypothetical protein VN820_04670 [Acidimicrobiales bacterium]|nr:hypothetical protein [Acidimicrobiales bacterium]